MKSACRTFHEIGNEPPSDDYMFTGNSTPLIRPTASFILDGCILRLNRFSSLLPVVKGTANSARREKRRNSAIAAQLCARSDALGR